MVFPYMIGKDRWGSYGSTFEFSAKIFASRDPCLMAARSGSLYDVGRSIILLKSFGQDLSVDYPGARVTFSGTEYSPNFAWCLCVVNYLARSDGTPLSGQPVSYRELEDGAVYYQAFRREAIEVVARQLGSKSPGLLARAVLDLGGEVTGGADFACALPVLPQLPLMVKIWFPDEEINGSANILFDSTANHYLHTEDIAAIGEMTVRLLIRHCRMLEENEDQGVDPA